MMIFDLSFRRREVPWEFHCILYGEIFPVVFGISIVEMVFEEN